MQHYFSTKYNTYKATVKENFIKIGGDKYSDCINIAIIYEKGIPSYAKIPHLQSEPECGIEKLLNKSEKGATIDFIRGSIQFVHYIYPSIKRFEFMDDSKIECANNKPPRKINKPLSLAHSYIAKYGKTWYEYNFGAKMTNNEQYTNYRKSIAVLSEKINMDYAMFKNVNFLSDEQDAILKPIYENSKTWFEFFNGIKKEEQCMVFSMWLPYFINNLLDNTYNPNSWFIEYDRMQKTEMNVVNKKGGARKTKRTRKNYTVFSNNLGYGAMDLNS